ncbi:relaxase/mobilization nuclease domain-containing protein [Pseudomonas viridiflava]|uniref:relaxase/mobilization nuclease domain-containing protein n=1 Tax=Pseudomonas viridiflava TaxID=33069 RepID=UPI0020CA8C5B|nr:relaxase/mobilization nuclease domain-containing protein [Pseudomonas viridiflava]
MINKMKTRTGGYKNGVANSAKYILKTDPKGDSIDSSIARLDGESDQAYANRIEKIFESARVPNQKNLYQHNALAFHPTDGEKLTDAQMIDIAKEVYLKNGLSECRHYLFVVERNTEHPHVHALLHLTDLETNRVNNKFVKYNPILEKLENKYGLYNQHRIPTPENTTPSNDQKSEKDLKKNFKTELKAILENALTASEFLILADGAGFDITHNGKTSYSLTKDDQTFKASDLGMSYKTLKAALGDDPEFAATLASLHTDKPQNDDAGSITAPTNEAAPAPTNQPTKIPGTATYPAPDHESESETTYSDYGSQSSNERRKERADYFTGVRMQKTLYANYHHDDQGNYYFNRNDKKAFEFDSSSNTVSYKTSTPSSVKAGLQKLTEDKNPCEIFLRGGENFKREMWLQFHLMKLDEKGYTLNGFKPSQTDLEVLELKLSEQTKFYNGSKNDPLIEKQIEALTQKPEGKTILDKVFAKKETPDVGEDEKVKMDIENFTTFKVSDTKLKAKTDAEKSAQSGAAGVLAGAVEKLTDMSGSFSGGVQNELLAEMAALDREAKNSQQSAENAHHQNKRNRGPQYRPD